MNKLRIATIALALAGAAFLAMPASAAPLGISGVAAGAPGTVSADSNIIQVQRRGAVQRRGVVRGRPVGRGRVVVRGRGYGRGVGAAAVGLGILGAAAIAAGAANAEPRECWVERRPVYDRWGNYIGDRNTRVCN